MKFAVTGATGYIGSRFAQEVLSEGHKVVALSRRQPVKMNCDWIPYELASQKPIELPQDTDVLIHFATGQTSHDQEISAARLLIGAAQLAGARVIFVSSQTARKDAPTSYGRVKWSIEQDVLTANGLVVRLGQVYGGPELGLFGTLTGYVRRLPALPAFMPSPLVQPIHVDDCVEGLLKLLKYKVEKSYIFCLAAPDPITFTEFLRAIANSRIRHRKLFVPVPSLLFKLSAKITGERLSSRLGMTQLCSLFSLSLMPVSKDLEMIGLNLRPLSSGMHRSGSDRRRRLIQEGMALLEYVLKSKPSPELVMRYVRMIEALRSGYPIGVPRWSVRWPIALTLLDGGARNVSVKQKEFAWRADAAAVIAEASRQGAVRFIGSIDKISPLIALLQMALAICKEISWRILRFVLPPSFIRFSTSGYDA